MNKKHLFCTSINFSLLAHCLGSCNEHGLLYIHIPELIVKRVCGASLVTRIGGWDEIWDKSKTSIKILNASGIR